MYSVEMNLYISFLQIVSNSTQGDDKAWEGNGEREKEETMSEHQANDKRCVCSSAHSKRMSW